jgi:hypothetical protein
LDADVASYRDWLVGERKLAERTANVNAAMIDLGKRNGSVVSILKRARTKGTLTVASAAVVLWGRWSHDDRLLRRAKTVAARRGMEETVVPIVTDDERQKLLRKVARLEEPYRSAMTVVVCSGLKLGTAFDLSRVLVDVARTEQVPLPAREGCDGVMWRAPDSIVPSCDVLLTYGGWERLQDVFGRDYSAAYKQLRILLRFLCRKAGLRQIRPSELGRMPVQPVEILDTTADVG